MFLKKYFLHLEKKNRLGSYEENNRYHSLIPCCHSDCFRPESRVGTQWRRCQRSGTYRSDQGAGRKYIPIDYITGTSIGAIIGSLYAMGYSPEEMLELMLSKEFAYWQTGTVEEQYTYYFKEPYPTPEFAHFSIDMSDSLQIKASFLPQSLINPIQMNQAFMALFSQATAKAGWNFDNLFVPFRCVASDIYTKKPIIFKNGDLGDAVRASMTFPFFFQPIWKDSIPYSMEVSTIISR